MQVNPWASDHMSSTFCVAMSKKRVQHAAAVESARTLDVEFTAYGEPIERVEVLIYLGRLSSLDDNNVRAVMNNLKKARI